jgi:hypothetical protein
VGLAKLPSFSSRFGQPAPKHLEKLTKKAGESKISVYLGLNEGKVDCNLIKAGFQIFSLPPPLITCSYVSDGMANIL